MELTATQETQASKEQPAVIAQVDLPEISTSLGMGIRLGMHTDSIQTLLRTLYTDPLSRQIKIEGRVLTDQQKDALQTDQTYRFYMSSRVYRQTLLLRSDLVLTDGEIARLLKAPFEPSSTRGRIGHETGYFDASVFIDAFLSGRPNDLLPIVGGLNRFKIGSDTLSAAQLRSISDKLREAFIEQEKRSRTAILSSPGYTSKPLYTVFQNSDYKKEFKEENLTNNFSKFDDKKNFYKKNY